MTQPTATPATNASKRMGQRVWMGLMLVSIASLLIWLGGWWWTMATMIIMVVGFRELAELFKAKAIQPSGGMVLAVSLVMAVVAHLNGADYLLPLLTFGFVAGVLRLLFRPPIHSQITPLDPTTDRPGAGIYDVAGTLLALIYVGFLPLHYILLRHLLPNTVVKVASWADIVPTGWPHVFQVESGAFFVWMTVAVIAASDVGAYFVGKAFGRHPLYPALSPRKTLEGAIGGGLFGLLVASGFLLSPIFDWQRTVPLALLLVVVAQLGDLFESLIKRDAGVKNSSELLASHGGLLDRLDSYMFCGVVSYYYIRWVILQEGLAQEILQWPVFHQWFMGS
ncbi:MAG: phosphatidate cytidylyltransferase [Vampirovibrionales bacterium]|nr:phosphatidate cytidylyltransferase [Vampirovibrionales bacterium]